MAPAPDHRQVDAGLPALGHDGEHVGISVRCLHRLLVQHARQCAEAVTDRGRFFELQLGGELLHPVLKLMHHVVGIPAQKAHRAVDVLRVARRVDQSDAGRAAAVDLVQQAGTRAVREHRVLAGAQPEHLLQQLDAVLDCPGVRIRPEILSAAVDCAAVVRDAGKLVVRELQIRIRLVVAEGDVVTRRQRLDQAVLEQQRLGLGAGDRRVDARNARQHVRGPGPDVPVEVSCDALLQVARLADIERGPSGVQHAVDARQMRQAVDHAARVEFGFGGGHELQRHGL